MWFSCCGGWVGPRGLIAINHCRISATRWTTLAAGHHHQCRVLRDHRTVGKESNGEKTGRSFLTLFRNSLCYSRSIYIRKRGPRPVKRPRSFNSTIYVLYVYTYTCINFTFEFSLLFESRDVQLSNDW